VRLLCRLFPDFGFDGYCRNFGVGEQANHTQHAAEDQHDLHQHIHATLLPENIGQRCAAGCAGSAKAARSGRLSISTASSNAVTTTSVSASGRG